MIVLAIAAVVVIFLSLATAAMYFAERDNIAQKQERSAATQGDRVKEDLELGYFTLNGSTHLHVENLWGHDSTITGLMVVCDNGTVHTERLGYDIPFSGTGDGMTFNATQLGELAGRC